MIVLNDVAGTGCYRSTPASVFTFLNEKGFFICQWSFHDASSKSKLDYNNLFNLLFGKDNKM